MTIAEGGSGYPSDREIIISIGRRPPFFQSATAQATVVKGKVAGVTVTSQISGYYAKVPIVVIHDMKGTGRGAACRAEIEAGQVSVSTLSQRATIIRTTSSSASIQTKVPCQKFSSQIGQAVIAQRSRILSSLHSPTLSAIPAHATSILWAPPRAASVTLFRGPKPESTKMSKQLQIPCCGL